LKFQLQIYYISSDSELEVAGNQLSSMSHAEVSASFIYFYEIETS